MNRICSIYVLVLSCFFSFVHDVAGQSAWQKLLSRAEEVQEENPGLSYQLLNHASRLRPGDKRIEKKKAKLAKSGLLYEHKIPVMARRSLIFPSLDSPLFLTTGESVPVCLWDTEGQLRCVLEHPDNCFFACFLPDKEGEKILTLAKDGIISSDDARLSRARAVLSE